MRTLCFWLMIVLMPLRAWAGDAMAVQMALGGPGQHSVAMAAADCHSPDLQAAPDHGHSPSHGQEHAGSHGAAGKHAAGEHNCLHCDICQSKVHAVVLVAPVAGVTEQELPAYGNNPMEPGPTESVFKPPIV